MGAYYLHWLSAIYLTGAAVSAFFSLRYLSVAARVKRDTGTDLLALRPDMKRWLVWRVPLWPYYLAGRHSPASLVSSLFFSRYGNPGRVYYGTGGLKNFLNDVFKGKNRYRGCRPQKFCVRLGKEQAARVNRVFFEDAGKPLYAVLLCAKHKGRYLLRVIYSSDRASAGQGPATRFDLDECERLCEKGFRKKLAEICPEETENVLRAVEKGSDTTR